MRADGVVDFFPLAQFAVEGFHLQRAGGDLIELLGVGAVGALHGTVEFGRTRREHEQVQAALLAGLLELGGELTAAIDLQGEWGRACGAARYRETGWRFGRWRGCGLGSRPSAKPRRER